MSMKEIRIEKITVNMGVGQSGAELEKSQKVLEKITGVKSVQTVAKIKQPKWDIRPGLPIGAKVTLRGKKGEEFLGRALQAKDNILSRKNFDAYGNAGFGVKEHIDLPDEKYDPNIGIRGFDVLVTLERPGYRVKRRKIENTKIGKKHVIPKEEAINFMRKKFGLTIE